MKRHEQKTKPSSLTTTPQKFQQERGAGSSNTDSPGAIGKNIAAILKPKADSSSRSVIPSTSQSAAIYHPTKEQIMFPFPVNGTSTETATPEATYSDLMKKLQK